MKKSTQSKTKKVRWRMSSRTFRQSNTVHQLRYAFVYSYLQVTNADEGAAKFGPFLHSSAQEERRHRRSTDAIEYRWPRSPIPAGSRDAKRRSQACPSHTAISGSPESTCHPHCQRGSGG